MDFNYHNTSKEELIIELRDLQQKYNSLKDSSNAFNREPLQADVTLDKIGSLAKIGYLKYDLNEFVFSSSKEVLKIFEIADETELNFENFLKHYTDETSDILRRAINLAIQEGKSFIRDSEIITASGLHKWIRTKGEVIQDGSIGTKYLFVTIQDISEIRLIDRVTQESVFTLEQVEQITHIGHWSVNIMDGSFYHSDEIKRIFGYEPSEYALSVEEAINSYHPDDRGEVIRYFNKAIETGEGYEFDLRVIQPSGIIRHVHSKGYAEKNSEGKVIRVYGVFQDITDSKLAEENLKDRNQFIETLINIAPGMLYIYDIIEHKNVFSNDGIFRVLGYTVEDIKEMGSQLIPILMHPDDLTYYINNILPLYATAKDGEQIVNQCRMRDNKGNWCWLEFTEIIYKRQQDGTPQQILGMGIDISVRKRSEQLLKEKSDEIEAQNEKYKQINEELIKAKEQAIESDRLKTAFLQNMSHEIRTPMNAIMGFSDLLFKNADDKTKIKKFTDIISQRSSDLLDIINDILDIAKIESGQLPVNIESCNLDELFAELDSFFSEYQNRIGKQHIKLSFQNLILGGNNLILTDKTKVKQIFINLISNAFKFTNEGRIDFGCKIDENNNLLFFVSDTGIGIPANKHQFVFERFAQLHHGNKLNLGGTGLGLSIVKALVRLLGGEIFLESITGKGSMFSFTIPYKEAQSLDTKALMLEKSNYKSFLNKTILIVEDDPYNAMYLNEILSGLSLNIIITEHGQDSVKISQSQPVDLVLMDIRLPDMNGYEAIRQIKKLNSNIKIIAQTAYAAQDEYQKALNVGCVDYISKPFKQDTLLSMLLKHLSA